MYSHYSKGHGLLKMALIAFIGGLLGIVVGLLLGIVISLISYLLMSASPDVGFEPGYQNLYMLSTSLAMKGMVSGAAIGGVLGSLLGLKRKHHMMMGGMGGCGCCMSGKCGENCQCCDEHGNCMPSDKMEGCCGAKMSMADKMPMKDKGMKS